jgi:malonyl-CoA decarboxylase
VAGRAKNAAKPSARSHHAERLQVTLRKADEALSPRVLRRTLADLQAIVDPRVSEVEGGRRAHACSPSGTAPRRPRSAAMHWR